MKPEKARSPLRFVRARSLLPESKTVTLSKEIRFLHEVCVVRTLAINAELDLSLNY